MFGLSNIPEPGGQTPLSAHRGIMADLLQRIAERADPAAFRELYEAYGPRVKAYMMRKGADAATAEDLAQETLLTVWRKAELYDPERASAGAWIFTIARNLRIDTLRRAQRAPRDIDPSDVPDDPTPPDTILYESDNARRVRAALSSLPEEQRKVLLLSYFHDLAHAEISARTGIPLGTVKSRLRLAVSRLRDILGETR